jgi:hypothetical protein
MPRPIARKVKKKESDVNGKLKIGDIAVIKKNG